MRVALVPYKVPLEPGLLERVAKALDRQVREHFAPLWGIEASVHPVADWHAVPHDHARIILVDQLDSGALGVHANKDGLPYALVAARGEWSVVASHECLEMLADPTGNRLLRGPSPIEGQGEVELLVEVCDPCQGQRWSYQLDGVAVSDFCTPDYYDGGAEGAGPWSFRGALTGPRTVQRDGYVLWRVGGKSWWRRDWMGRKPADYSLGPISPQVSFLRGHIDRLWRAARRTRRTRQLALRKVEAKSARASELLADIERALEQRRGRRPAAPPAGAAAPPRTAGSPRAAAPPAGAAASPNVAAPSDSARPTRAEPAARSAKARARATPRRPKRTVSRATRGPARKTKKR